MSRTLLPAASRALLLSLFAAAALAADPARSPPSPQSPILFPHPWHMVSTGQTVPLGRISVTCLASDDRLRAAATAWLQPPPAHAANAPLVTVMLHDFAPEDVALLSTSFPGLTPASLGDQGYLLSVQPSPERTTVTIAASNERGRFYGLQTLKQLVSDQKLAVVTIADKPTLSRRGVPAGGWWWRNRERLIPLYASLKLNYIYAGGEMLDGKFGGPAMNTLWRQPFSDEDKRQLAACLELARANFTDLSLQMCPRGNPPLIYCSDEEIDLCVSKLSVLYDIGYRHFGINFDDLQNIGQNKVITDRDKARFGDDLGEAHRYFVEQVFTRLQKLHPDISFSFCPYIYSGFRHQNETGRKYLQALGRLPREIQLVTCPEDKEELSIVSDLTDRPQMIWDNQIADRSGTFVTALQRTAAYTDRDILGYLTLISDGDPFRIGYHSMADYMWSPERYDPESAEQAALVKSLGSAQAADAVRSYRLASARLESMPYPLLDKEARIAAMKADLEKVRQATDAMKNAAPAAAYAEAQRQTESLGHMVEFLQQRMEKVPFPIRVPRLDPGTIVPASDVTSPSTAWSRAATLTNFVGLRSNSSAPVQTTAQLLHDGKSLFVRVVCQEPNPAGIVAKHHASDEPVYEDDCVELFFCPDPDRQATRQVVINTLGTLYGGVKCTGVARVEKDQWVAEFSIPFQSLGGPVDMPTGTAWRFNVCRSRYQEKSDPHSSFAPLFSRHFSAPQRFWPLLFE